MIACKIDSVEMQVSSSETENGTVSDVCLEEVDKTSVLSLRAFLAIRICCNCSAKSLERAEMPSKSREAYSSMSARARASKHSLCSDGIGMAWWN